MGNKSSSSASGGSASTIVPNAVTDSHVLRINGYSKTKGIGVGKGIDSGIFRVGGHAWAVRYYPDGAADTSSDCISIFLCLRTAISPENPISVMARFKFSLLDQDGEPVSRYQYQLSTRDFVTFSASQRVWGFAKFLKRSGGLEGSDYLIDDSFRIKCEITIYKGCWNKRTSKKKEFIKVPPTKLEKELAGVLWAGEPADVTFEIGNEVCTAHRKVLTARSPVFKAEFSGPMKENTAAGSCRVQIHDMEPDVFRAMLQYIYTDTLPSIEKKEDGIIMAQHLLVAADRYDLKRLKLVCEDKLCHDMNCGNVAEILVLAEQHGCRGLKKACFEFLMSNGNLRAAMATEGYDHLKRSCPSLLDELLSKLTR